MKIITSVMILFLLSSAFLGVCSGAAWFPEHNSAETQKIHVTLQPLENTHGSVGCSLILRQADPDNIHLNLSVVTMALFWQDANFETWLTIDYQEPEKMNSAPFTCKVPLLDRFTQGRIM